jgi:hypothetical protein
MVALSVVTLLVVACGFSPVGVEAGGLATVIGSGELLPQIPDADLTVVMSPGGAVPTDINTEGVIPETVDILATFATGAGPGYIARYKSTEQRNDCYQAATPDSSSGSCAVNEERFFVLSGNGGSRQGATVEFVAIFGPPDVVAYEVTTEDGFIVAIRPVEGHGYANWVGHGFPVTITAHFADGTTEKAQ